MISINEFADLNCFVCASGTLKNEEARITYDNRTYKDENVFVAIVGERYNPLNDLDKLDRRIKYIIHENNLEVDEKYIGKFVFIKVKNIISFCQEAAKIIASNFQRTNFLFAIAGSNGKTTTKEMLDFVLKDTKTSFIATQKNNNNHLGVPFTLFQIRKETEFAIIELGSNHPGEMEVLNSICEPKHGIVTNIGYTHMKFFPTLEDVFEEEANIYKHIKKSNSKKIFFKNDDDKYLSTLEGDFCISFGYKGKDYTFSFENELISVTEMLTNEVFVLRNEYITGKHNYYNMAVSFVVLKNITTLSSEKIISSLNIFKPTPNRGEWKKIEEKDIFLDAYNANPSSMIASVEGFIEDAKKDFKMHELVFILGDMNELGTSSKELHVKVAKHLKDLGVENVRFIGRFASDYLSGFSEAKTFVSAEQYRNDCFKNDLKNYNSFLIKGSRSLQLESILDIK